MSRDPLTSILLDHAGGEGRLIDRLRDLERRIQRFIDLPDTCGYVQSNGTRAFGEGFGSSRLALGVYHLQFSRDFRPYAMVVAMCDATFAAQMSTGYTPTPNQWQLTTYNTATRAAADSGFFFIAKQP